ncbi:MAG: DUF6588 family protein [Bacteroidota bacterium]|nr:hypothetical protein [Cytophagales bacterium]MCE2957729.1 hypothetical protein [Flammeovirgaceae bacterium]MCZ8071715.1 hypothetical protein [Cytophagales bacterium]
MKQPILTLICAALISVSAVAQSDLDNLIKGSTEDANYLVKGYITPALNTVGYGLNQGWYNTAKPHKVLGFDLTITAAAISIPSADLSYRVENSKLSTIDLVTPTPTGGGANVPTIFGSDVAPTYRFRAGGSTFQGAPGLNLDIPVAGTAVPIPMVQLGIGLPKGTDVKLRFFPNTGLGAGGRDGSVGMFGIGVMHDVKQYIPGVKELPFDLSAFVGYTKLNFDVNLDPTNNPSQKATFGSSATTIQGLISKKISVLTFYGGLGFNIIGSDLNVKGTFDLDGNSATTVDRKDNPISISNSTSSASFTAGLRLKLAIFTFHGDYTFQKYNALTLGFGFNVR